MKTTFSLDNHQKWIEQINSEIGDRVYNNRQTASNSRYAIWDGQSPDGRKRQSLLGKPPKPFEGASDNRIRLSDFLVRYQSALLMTAMKRGMVNVAGVESKDMRKAANVKALLMWQVNNQLRASWRREWKKLLSYAKGDAPGGAVMGVFWQERQTLTQVTITSMEFMELLLGGLDSPEAQQDPNIQESTRDLIENPERLLERIQIIRLLFGVSAKQARAAAKDVAELGEFSLDIPQPEAGGIRLCAYRLYEDYFTPGTALDMETGPHYVREWLTKEELQARVISNGYSQEFVDALTAEDQSNEAVATRSGPLGGMTGFRVLVSTPQEKKSELTDANFSQGWSYFDTWKNYFEVVTCYYQDIEKDVVGKFYTTFSTFLKIPAIQPTVLEYQHRRFPFIFYSNETLGSRLMDTRGVVETAITPQNTLKLLADTAEDAVQIGTLPPIRRPKYKQNVQMLLAPLGEIEEMRPGEVGWLEPPPYPVVHREHREETLRQIAEYYGVPHPKVNPMVTQVMNQDMIDDFLLVVSEVLMMMFELDKQFMTEEQYQRITGTNDALPRTPADVQGEFDIMIRMDGADLDPTALESKMKSLIGLLGAVDRKGTVQWDRVAQVALSSFDPTMADFVLAPSDAAAANIIDEEDGNLAKIVAGVEPPIGEDLSAPQIRLQRLQENLQKNPAIFGKMTDDSKAILENYVKKLEFQVQQQENANTGRYGVSPTFE